MPGDHSRWDILQRHPPRDLRTLGTVALRGFGVGAIVMHVQVCKPFFVYDSFEWFGE